MPAQIGRRRQLSVGIALLALILGAAFLGWHATSWRPGSARAVATSVQTGPQGLARAADLPADLGHPVAGPHADLTTPPDRRSPFVAPGRAVVVETVPDASATPVHPEHPGRAPPTA